VNLGSARARAITLRFAAPVRTARGTFHERSLVVLELHDTDGVGGYGEAAPWPGFGTETIADSLAVLQHAEYFLGTADLEPDEWPAALATLFDAAPAARAALEAALWDLAARRVGRSLADLLATRVASATGAALERVTVSALLVEQAPEALREEAARVGGAGHSAAKLKIGAPLLADDVARVRAARDGLGPNVALRADANGAWSEREAREALTALAPFRLEYIEQPLRADDLEGMARLRRTGDVRIAADESVATADGTRRVLEAEAADVLVLKPAVLGGPARALRLAAQARRAGCDVVFTHTFESAIGVRHLMHCAAAWGDPAAAHGLPVQRLFVEDVGESLRCEHGAVQVPCGPGIGISP
jgi:o-succinylbenzoate synthase